MNTLGRLMLLAGLAYALVPNPVSAQEDGTPTISGEFSVEIQNDNTYSSDDGDEERNDLYTTTEADINVHANDAIFVNAHLTLEPVEDPDPGEDRYFDDLGAYVDALTLNYRTDTFGAYAGKFAPNFSIGYDAAPGVYGADILGDDVEMTERIGFGGDYSFDGGSLGSQTLGGSVFYIDTTVLSESWGTKRPRTKESDGGAGNTESLGSFAVSLDGEDIPTIPGLRYHTGFVRQETDLNADAASIADELRFAAALEWEHPIGDDWTVTPIAEYVRFWNADGDDAVDKDYLTGGVTFGYQSWNLNASYTGRFTETDGASDVDDYQVSFGAGYEFEFGLTADVGWKFVEEDDVESQVFGVLLAYGIEF